MRPRFGRPFRNPSAAAAEAPVFDPATLALTGWWRDYAGSAPWVGTASAGTSGDNDLTETGGSAPAAGSDLNGYGTADFDGSSKFLIPDDTLATYYDADGYGGWALLNLDAINTDVSTANGAIDNDTIWGTSAGYHAIYLRSNGGTPLLGISHYASGATYDVATVSVSTGSWVLIHWRFTGTHVQVGVNGTWGTAVAAAGNLHADGLALIGRVGRSYHNTAYIDGTMAETGVMDFSPSDDEINNVKSYVNSRYSLSL